MLMDDSASFEEPDTVTALRQSLQSGIDEQ